MQNDTPRRQQEGRKLRQAVFLLMPLPLLIAAMAAFSPLPQGRWIALGFVLPVVVAYGLVLWPGRVARYRPSHYTALLLALAALVAAAFLSLPAAFLAPATLFFWQLSGVMALALALGLLAGRYRLDTQALMKAQQRRFRAAPGLLAVHSRIASGFGMAPPARLSAIDWVIRAAFGLYVVLVVIGAVFGGAAGLIILEIMRPLILGAAALDTHATAMIGLGMIALPPIGFILPALWQAWHGLRLLEATAAPDGRFDIQWHD